MNIKMQKQAGFSIIEITIWLVLVAIVSGAVLASFGDSSKQAAYTKVKTNFADGAAYVGARVAKYNLDTASGLNVTLPADQAAWTAELNGLGSPTNAKGNAAYLSGSGDLEGSVRVDYIDAATMAAGECGDAVFGTGHSCLVLAVNAFDGNAALGPAYIHLP